MSDNIHVSTCVMCVLFLLQTLLTKDAEEKPEITAKRIFPGCIVMMVDKLDAPKRNTFKATGLVFGITFTETGKIWNRSLGCFFTAGNDWTITSGNKWQSYLLGCI